MAMHGGRASFVALAFDPDQQAYAARDRELERRLAVHWLAVQTGSRIMCLAGRAPAAPAASRAVADALPRCPEAVA